MKKAKLIIVSLGMLCLLTGCGEKKLHCTLKESDQETSVTFIFDSKDKIKSGNMNIVFKVDEDTSDEELNEGIKVLQDSYKEMGFETKASKGENSVTISMNFKANQLNDLFGDNVDIDTGYDALKTEIEEEGATCK